MGFLEIFLAGGLANNEGQYNFESTFSLFSFEGSFNILNAFDLPKDYRKFSFYLGGGIGFLAYNGEGNNVDFDDNSLAIPLGMGLKYKSLRKNTNYIRFFLCSSIRKWCR